MDNKILKADSINAYNEWAGVETRNPLISIIHLNDVKPLRHARKLYGLYAIFLKDAQCGELRYGCKYYDYKDGTMLFVAPGQVVGADDDGSTFQPDGWVLLFHPDLLVGTPLAKHIRDYSFFSYDTDEALHVSKQERELLMDCYKKINYELDHAIDKHSRQLIVDSIKMLLDYSTRFYDRQFITRENVNRDILSKIADILDDYYESDKPIRIGLPSVQYVADQVHLSPNYLSDMVKKETGEPVLEHIHSHIIDLAKTQLTTGTKTVSEVSYQLGFQYPQHFTRLFKKRVGITPTEYREKINA